MALRKKKQTQFRKKQNVVSPSASFPGAAFKAQRWALPGGLAGVQLLCSFRDTQADTHPSSALGAFEVSLTRQQPPFSAVSFLRFLLPLANRDLKISKRRRIPEMHNLCFKLCAGHHSLMKSCVICSILPMT